MDWTSLWLVFEKQGSEWYLVDLSMVNGRSDFLKTRFLISISVRVTLDTRRLTTGTRAPSPARWKARAFNMHQENAMQTNFSRFALSASEGARAPRQAAARLRN